MSVRTIKAAAAAVIVAVIMAMSPSTAAQAVKGEKSVGPRIGYISENNSATAGLFFQYAFSSHFRLAPEIGYVFRHDRKDAFMFDINAHFPFGFTGEKVAFYPLAGLNYSSWNCHFDREEFDKIKDVSTRKSRFGMNFGAGFDLRCSETLKLSLEAKYLLIKEFSCAQIGVGISYVF